MGAGKRFDQPTFAPSRLCVNDQKATRAGGPARVEVCCSKMKPAPHKHRPGGRFGPMCHIFDLRRRRAFFLPVFLPAFLLARLLLAMMLTPMETSVSEALARSGGPSAVPICTFIGVYWKVS